MADGLHPQLKMISKRLHAVPPEQINIELARGADVSVETSTDASVMILIIERENRHSIIFTKRTGSLRHHAGQISFPGGKVDEQDADHWHTARRETHEEIGLEPQLPRLLGYLPRCLTVTGFLITPCVGVVKDPAPFILNPGEVDDAFELPLSLLQKNETYSFTEIVKYGRSINSWIVAHESETIWGITAGLTRMLFEQALK